MPLLLTELCRACGCFWLFRCAGEKGGGLGLSSRQTKALTHSRSFLTSPAPLGPDLRLSGLAAAQTADSPQTPPRPWWEGDTAVPVCIELPNAEGGCGGVQGTGSGHSGTPLFFSGGGGGGSY